MKWLIAALIFTCFCSSIGLSQAVSINTDGSAPDPSAILDVKSTDKGILVPRMSTFQRSIITSPATGLLVFDISTLSFWLYDGSDWVEIKTSIPTWLSDEDLDTRVHVEESSDEDKIRFRVPGTNDIYFTGSPAGVARLNLSAHGANTYIGGGSGANAHFISTGNSAFGDSSLSNLTTANDNTAVGSGALHGNETTDGNTAVGKNALHAHRVYGFNTAVGYHALYADSSGTGNTAVGSIALEANYTGQNNTAIGSEALTGNTSGSFNSALGRGALFSNTTGSSNTAIGRWALALNTTGYSNTGVGVSSLLSNTIGRWNTAVGQEAMLDNVDGEENVAIGYGAMQRDTTGSSNVAVGRGAMENNLSGSDNTVLGKYAGALGQEYSGNVFLGYEAGFNETNSDRLYIDNSSTSTPLIYGEFDNDSLKVNGTLSVTSALDIDGNTLVVDAINNRVGIGLSSPSETLEVAGGMQVDGSTFNIDETNHRVGIGTSVPSETLEVTGGMKVDGTTLNVDAANNRVGIGTSFPSKALHVAGDAEIDGITFIVDASNNRIGIGTGTPTTKLEVAGGVKIDGSTFNVDETNNRVGIGTASPTHTLGVAGQANLNQGIAEAAALRVNGDEALWYDGTYFSWGFDGAYNYFRDGLKIGDGNATSPVSDIHIEESGDASITLESSGGVTDAFIQLTDDATTGSEDWVLRRDASDAGKLQWRHDNTPMWTMTTAGNLGLGETNPAYQLELSTNSAAKPGTNTWTVPSDKRLKEQIEPYADGLASIMEIRPVTFHYNKASGFETEPEYVGVVAQELQTVTPYMVSETAAGYLTVDNSAMTYMLINAVKELSAENDRLGAENDRQDALISKLFDQMAEISAQLEGRHNPTAAGRLQHNVDRQINARATR